MAQRNRVEALDRIHVPSVDGRAVPLRALADPGMETGPARIERHDRERSVTLTAYVGAGHLTGAVTQAALDRVRGAVRLPAGCTIALGGEAEEQESGNAGMTAAAIVARSEEHTSELQSLMRISYAVFCLKKKNKRTHARTQD